MFNPSRLTLARKRRRYSKKELAEAIGVTPHSVLRYESGKIAPTREVELRLSKVLDFPIVFFSGHDVDELGVEGASFRSLSSISAKDRNSALAAGSLAFMFADWVEERFDLPKPDLLDLGDDTPEIAARSLREHWGLGERPVKNMVELLEAKGVRLFSLAENTVTVDAFSVWRREVPFVFLNTVKTAERSRYDAAHELGHLVLHLEGGPTGRAAEHEANQFASAFLLPEADVVATIPRVHTLNQVIEAKKRWAVSVMALLHRLRRLEIMSDWQYRMFCIDATSLGYRREEPFGISRERSVVWQKVLTMLWSERVTKVEIAKDLQMPTEEVENFLFGLASETIEEQAVELRPPLRLVP
ncbi:MAG: XRE family transcriptional regulator [Rhodospirillales bacterium]|nr:XRE family transcriptional regulator [Rhodospirillales bacterium]MDE0381062.1 XRE family transcriptional regulator [Rhodospirillales bacterium]